MNDRLIIQSIGDGVDWYLPWMKISRPIHESYAAACNADYKLYTGRKDPRIHPAWNRIPMFLDALVHGYRQVLWLDADTLVVDQAVDIFTDTDDATPWHMVRAKDTHVEMPWGEHGWDVYNDGVLLANNLPETIEAFEWVWARRREALQPHHHASLWELNFINDYVFEHRDVVAELDFRFNWMPFDYACPKSEAVILAYHGMPHQERWDRFQADVAETYGAVACD